MFDPVSAAALRRAVIVALALTAVVAGCGDDATGDAGSVAAGLTVALADIVALDRLSTGEVIAGERTTGRIHRFSSGDAAPEVALVAELEVTTEGQRGLLGLVVDDRDRVFAAWTDLEEQLVVGQIDIAGLPDPADRPIRIVWNGFASSTGANGGHLDLLADGRLVIGVGTLRRSALIDDPGAVNGKMLALDPDGRPDQEPEVLSGGWKNPFAFTVTAAGELWLADNEPEDGSPERIARGDLSPDRIEITELADQLAPSVVIDLGPDRLGLCSFLTGELYEVELTDGRASAPGRVLASGCRTAALVIGDGALLSDQDRLRYTGSL